MREIDMNKAPDGNSTGAIDRRPAGWLRRSATVFAAATGNEPKVTERSAMRNSVTIPATSGTSAAAEWPVLLTTEEAASLLRTSRKAIYALVERGQLPGVTRLGRRVLLRSEDLLEWLRHKSAPSPKE